LKVRHTAENDNWNPEWIMAFLYLVSREARRLMFIISSKVDGGISWLVSQKGGVNLTQHNNLSHKVYSEFVTKPWTNIGRVIVENSRALLRPFLLLTSLIRSLVTTAQKGGE